MGMMIESTMENYLHSIIFLPKKLIYHKNIFFTNSKVEKRYSNTNAVL
jgi:hypothetical protein